MVKRLTGTSLGPQGHLPLPNSGPIIALALLLLLLQAGGPHAVLAESKEPGWEIFVGITAGIAVQEHKGAGSSSINLTTTSTDPIPVTTTTTTTTPISGDMPAVSPNFGFQLGVTSPRILSGPVGIRFFGSGSIVPTIAFSRDVAKEGDPTGIVLPRQEANGDAYPESAIGGTGSVVTGQLRPLGYSLDLGVEISSKLVDRTIYLRPSIGWLLVGIDVDAAVLKAQKPEDSVQAGFPRQITLLDSKTRIFNAVGAGLELGVNLGRRGIFSPSLFIGGQFYGVPGNRKIRLADNFQVSGEAIPATAQWEYEVDPFLYRVNIGIRVGWDGLSQLF